MQDHLWFTRNGNLSLFFSTKITMKQGDRISQGYCRTPPKLIKKTWLTLSLRRFEQPAFWICRKFFRRAWQLKVDTYLRRKYLRLRVLPQTRQYYNNHLQWHFTIDKTITTDDNITTIDFYEHIRAFRTHAIYGLCILEEGTVANGGRPLHS